MPAASSTIAFGFYPSYRQIRHGFLTGIDGCHEYFFRRADQPLNQFLSQRVLAFGQITVFTADNETIFEFFEHGDELPHIAYLRLQWSRKRGSSLASLSSERHRPCIQWLFPAQTPHQSIHQR